jgi:hypothetical protein
MMDFCCPLKNEHHAGHLWLTACNPSYSGGRSGGSPFKPAWANSSGDPISKKPHHKNGLVEWLKE